MYKVLYYNRCVQIRPYTRKNTRIRVKNVLVHVRKKVLTPLLPNFVTIVENTLNIR